MHVRKYLSSSLGESDPSPKEAEETYGKAVCVEDGNISRKISLNLGHSWNSDIPEHVG